MWTPADQNALPTAEDMTNAMKTISTLEHELAEAEIRVEMLKKDLNKIKAWVSPVRRLNFDALTAIFEWCGDIDWSLPVKIAAVCNLWRQAVLSTPRAWSFVELQSNMSDSGIRMFFERSGQRALHIYLPTIRPFDLLLPILHRVQCLTIESPSHVPWQVAFPTLTQLNIDQSWGSVPVTFINTNQFPALSHLDLSTYLASSNPFSNSTLSFPLLESWRLRLTEDPISLSCLRSCQNTLVSLELIHYASVMFSDQCPIILPVLKCLQIFADDGAASWTIELKTPKLEVYEVYVGGDAEQEHSVHVDISTVIKMRSDQPPPLPVLTRLQNLQLDMDNIELLVSVLEELAVDNDICPNLRTIEVMEDRTQDTEGVWKILNDANNNRDHRITLTFVEELPSFPEIISATCGQNMPCSRYNKKQYSLF